MPEQHYSRWRKSSRSGNNNGNCVEVGFATTGAAIRDTKEAADLNRPMLEFSGAAFAAFLGRVKSGELG
ncbi:DUF397 domain-containing protein [Saccharopolyspora sp. CA-218241]|uniref:DUF397 domain-containing protein n=1 Tax=Saccharopolyspora sp. CA-218241 TaxID=3240027 RepID=UPI003D99A120